MAKVSTKSITSIDDKWEDDGTGLPYSGKAVQDFIKSELEKKAPLTQVGDIVDKRIQDSIFPEEGTIVTQVTQQGAGIQVTHMDSTGKTVTTPMDFSKEDPNARVISVAVQTDKTAINVGGDIKGNFGFTISQGNKILTGEVAKVQVRLTTLGSPTPFYTASLGYVQAAESADEIITESIPDLASIIAKNITGNAQVNVSISVSHTYSYEEEGQTVTRTATGTGTARIVVMALSLTSRIGIANTGLPGQVSIDYNAIGNGTKSVFLYKNGKLEDAVYNQEGTVKGNFVVDSLPSGITNFQLVASATSGTTTIYSSSHYFDLFGSATDTVICFKVEDFTGTIQSEANYQTPEFSAPKFSDFSFEYYVFNPSNQIVPATILTQELDAGNHPITSTSLSQGLSRTAYTYSKKLKSSNNVKVTIETDTQSRSLTISPQTSSIAIELPVENLELNLDADGRSNSEAEPGIWSYGDVTTKFEGVNWQGDGWIIDEGGSALLLQNGAKAEIDFPLFKSGDDGLSVTEHGCTFEILFKCKNATLDENDIISCYWKNNADVLTGLNVTTNYVGVNTGEVTNYYDDNGNVTQAVVTRVGTQYAQDNYYKFTFVIDPNAPSAGTTRGLCYGYINGILSYIAPAPSSFINLKHLPITIDSSYADIYIKSIKYYNTPLTHDQCVDGYIIDLSTSTEITQLYEKNKVLGSDAVGNPYLSPSTLIEMGKGVMIITGTSLGKNIVDVLNKSSDKKSYFGPVRLDYFAPKYDLDLGNSTVPVKGSPYNFMHKECAIRIQGTTSTKRPRKNWRLHFNKRNKTEKPSSGSFVVGGVARDDFKYSMSPSAVAVPIACLKNDFVDSSMTHNTGGAVIFNELTKELASLRNPAQEREYVDKVTDIKTRVAIEGFPIDVFTADSIREGTEYQEVLDESAYTNLTYIGQYNFNNDKSKSGKVFGFDGSYKYNAAGEYDAKGDYEPICMEFLDNYSPLDLFHMKFDTNGNLDETASYAKFTEALEVRAPETVTDHVAGSGIDDLATSEYLKDDKGNVTEDKNTYTWIPEKIKRVFNFIGKCAKEVAEKNGKSAYALNDMTSDELEALDWTSSEFLTYASEYFNMDSICAWYIWTDYTIAVDQRAKNMMLYTMDGKHWMLQYYDGDTMLGERNDCFLAYDYLTDRDTYDTSVKQYAMQGHDSWLWYLVRKNFNDKLISVCRSMRNTSKFTPEYFKAIFNGQFVENWSQRQYNYSQDYKYIQPLNESGFDGDIGNNYINTAQGSREAHRTYTIENRFNLLDSKYTTDDYTKDAFPYVGGTGTTNQLTIKGSIPFYFGWITTGQGLNALRQHVLADASNGYIAELTISDNGANNMAMVLGASRIKELTFKPGSLWDCTTQGKSVNLKSLQKLVADSVLGTGAPNFSGSNLLTHLSLNKNTFSGVEGLEKCSKLSYLDIRGTNIKSVKFAEGSPLKEVKLATPQKVYLSNLKELSYKEGDTANTLTVEGWGELSELLINKCPNIDWEALVAKLVASPASQKYLRVTGINKTADITWLDQFDGIYGLNENSAQITTSAQLQGVLHLTEYTDDTVVNEYRAKYGNNGLLEIRQPEYTIIEADEGIREEKGFNATIVGNITNLDNGTGARNSTQYVPSGHITNIISRCHRYLGKVTAKGNVAEIPTLPNATDIKSIKTRDARGSMCLIQLEDKDSRYYAPGYNSSLTRREADLSGAKGKGEVYVKIPGFWYKGINFLSPYDVNLSRKYTCYSSQEERPSKSDQTRVVSTEALLHTELVEDSNEEGLFRMNRLINNTNAADTILDKISSTENKSYDIIRVDVEGYKKVRYPISVGQTCCVFTDTTGKVITNINGSIIDVGKVYISSNVYAYNGMPAIATIPAGAKWFYIGVPKFVSGAITTDPCDIVLHRGDNYTSGEEMTVENAKDWIADMEPDWVYSDPVCIAAAECASDDSLSLYSPFDGSRTAAVGSGNADVSDLNIKGQWFQHSMSEAAFSRGLQLVDYEATKLIAMLFTAKYGRRNSQNVIGAGTSTTGRRLGASRQYGMTDTTIPLNIAVAETWASAAIPTTSSSGQISYTEIGTPVFLGIENIQGNVLEWMDRAFMANEEAKHCGKLRITNPDLSTRRVYGITPSGNYPVSVVHGKYCDICSCSGSGGSTLLGYCDYQSFDASLRTGKWANVRALRRSSSSASPVGGVFFLSSDYSVGFSSTSIGSRLIFRGNITETSDIDYFEKLTELR